MAMASDTLSISKDLRAAGFNEQQADALATHMAAMPANLASREDLAFGLAELELKVGHRIDQLDHKVDQLDHKVDQLDHKVDQLDHKVDQIEPRLLLKLGAGMVGGFGLVLTAISIGVGVILNQLG